MGVPKPVRKNARGPIPIHYLLHQLESIGQPVPFRELAQERRDHLLPVLRALNSTLGIHQPLLLNLAARSLSTQDLKRFKQLIAPRYVILAAPDLDDPESWICPEPDQEQIGLLIGYLERLLKQKARRTRKEPPPTDLGHRQRQALPTLLSMGGGGQLSDISRAMGDYDTGDLTGTLRSLEERGLVDNPDRGTYHLTEDGRSMALQLESQLNRKD